MEMIVLDAEDRKSKAHYSQAVVHQNIIYLSGQLPLTRGETQPANDTIEYQTKTVLEKLESILKVAKSDKNKVLKVTIFLTDIHHWDKVNAIYADFFGEHRPARTIIPTKILHYNCLIELDAIAYRE